MEVLRWSASPGFAERPNVLRMIDGLAKRYGRWPHEVLDLSAEELTLAVLCGEVAASDLNKRLRRSKGMVFPTLSLDP